MRKHFSFKFFWFTAIIFSLCCRAVIFAHSSREISNFEKNKFYKSGLTDYPEVDTNLDIKYYKIFLEIKLIPNNIIGEVTINGIILNSPDSIFFNLSNVMAVDSVKYNGSITGYIHSKDKIKIHPFKDRQENSFSVLVYYHGLPNPTGFGSFEFGTNNNTSVIWSLSEPFGASDWFPCKNFPSDKADSSDVWIKCPTSFTGVSNGILMEVVTNPDNTKTFKWKNSYPIASYLLSVAVTNYSLYTNYFKYSSSDSMPVFHYMYPETIDSLKPTLDKTVYMLRIFSTRFGLYPFTREKYGHAQTNMGGAMEHQTATSIGVVNEYVIAHELGHQWFGDKITCRDWHHIWLNEGFATYSECIYVEDAYGKTAFNQYVLTRMADAKKAVGTIYVQDVTSVSEIFNAYRSYAKGGVVLHMLRGIVGDSTFFRILKSYAADTSLAYGNAVTEDFRRVAESVSGLQLGYFFNEWIYGNKYPVYNISWNFVEMPDEEYMVLFNLIQTQSSNPPYFTMPFDVKINTSRGDTIFHSYNSALNQTFSFIVKGYPNLVTFDPDNKILKDKHGDDPITIVGYNLSQNYPNPFNPGTTINYEIAGHVDVKIKVYDAIGRQMAVLVNEKQKAGKYSVLFSGKNFASGVYFYKISAGDFSDVKKMVIIK
jgi:aminopeptidase N